MTWRSSQNFSSFPAPMYQTLYCPCVHMANIFHLPLKYVAFLGAKLFKSLKNGNCWQDSAVDEQIPKLVSAHHQIPLWRKKWLASFYSCIFVPPTPGSELKTIMPTIEKRHDTWWTWKVANKSYCNFRQDPWECPSESWPIPGKQMFWPQMPTKKISQKQNYLVE